MSDMAGLRAVSTGDQDVAGQMLRLQQAGAIKVFTDVRSGRSMDKPGLIALLDYARRGDTLAVVRLDRLGRSLAELLSTVTMLKERGIALVSLEERIDTGSAAGELVFHVFGAIAHFERRLIAEDQGWHPRCPGSWQTARSQPLDQEKVRRRSSWWRLACRRPWRRGNSAWDGPPSTGKSAGRASSEARSRPAHCDHQVFRLSVGWRTTNAMPSSWRRRRGMVPGRCSHWGGEGRDQRQGEAEPATTSARGGRQASA